jgi:hypothetical protein
MITDELERVRDEAKIRFQISDFHSTFHLECRLLGW